MSAPDLNDRIALITLNRPAAMNAVNAELSTAVGRALEAAVADAGVRAIVVTGTGRAFCAGADLKELAQGRSIHADGHPEWGFAGLIQHWDITRLPYDGDADRWFDPAWLVASTYAPGRS